MWFFARWASARWLAPLALAIGFVQVVPVSSTVWNDGLREAVNSSLYAGIAVGICAAIDARRQRTTYPPVTGGARRLAPAVGHVAGNAVWGMAVLLVLSGTVLAGMVGMVPWRTPQFGITIVGLAWMCAMSGIGWLIGWWLPYYLAVPGMLLIGWLGNAVLADPPDQPKALLSGIDDGGFMAHMAPQLPVLAVQTVAFAGIAFGCIAATRWAVLPRSGRRATGGALTAVAASFIVVVATVGPARAVEQHDAAGPRVCGHTPVPSCSWPGHDPARRAAARMAHRMWQPLRKHGARLPDGLVDTGLSRPDRWMSTFMPAGPPSQLHASTSLQDGLAIDTLAWLWCGQNREPELGKAVYDRRHWLSWRAAPPGQRGRFTGPAPPPRRIRRLSLPDQVKWLMDKPAGITCRAR